MPSSLSGIASSLIRRLLKRPSPAPSKGEVQYPLGLNRSQVDSLRKLSSIPQWQSYSVALSAACENELKALLSGLPHDEYLKRCGRIQGLLDAVTLPDVIDLKAQELDDHARSPADPAPGKRDLTFFGSHLWSPSRKPSIHQPVDRTG